jgi:hypothetical protein
MAVTAVAVVKDVLATALPFKSQFVHVIELRSGSDVLLGYESAPQR